MRHRFRFWATKITDSSNWALEASEREHVIKVLKLKVGDEIEVQSLNGEWAVATLTLVEKDKVMAHSTVVKRQPQEKHVLRVLMGALKPQDIDQLLPSLVELGVSEVHLFLTEKSEKRRLDQKYVERWQRILKSAAKQSKRAGIPVLASYPNLETLLDQSFYQNDQCVVFDPRGELTLQDIANQTPVSSMSIVVGSEAGLSEQELELLRLKGFAAVNCGPFILRGLTAAILAGSLATRGHQEPV